MSLGIKHTRPLRVITASLDGSPKEIPDTFDKVHAWARSLNLRTGERDSSGRVNLPWIAILENEEDTAEDDARHIDLWMPIDGAGPVDGQYPVRDIPHQNVAFKIHRAPMSRLEESIQELFEWAEEKKLTFRARHHRRIYTRGIDAHPEDPDWEAEIQIPLLTTRSN
jgi:DNA gyrase inhibitor GyrI